MKLTGIIVAIGNFFRELLNIQPKSSEPSEWHGGACYHLRFRIRRFGKWTNESCDYDCQNDDEGCKTARNILMRHGVMGISINFLETPKNIFDLYEIELTHGVPYICVDQD